MEKRALVTGASGGIGYVFAKRLAQEGYKVTAVARSEEKLKKLVEELPGKGHHYEVADLSLPTHVSRLATHISQQHYNLLINNAGAGIYKSFAATPVAEHERIMRLNCNAVVALSHAFVHAAQSGDALVNVASILAILPYPGAGVYAGTKAFVLSLSEGLWHENKERGVYVMALCPGVTESGFHEAAGGTSEEKPPARMTQSAEEVVEEALRALHERKRPVVVSGWKNRAGLFLGRFLTSKRIINFMGKI